MNAAFLFSFLFSFLFLSLPAQCKHILAALPVGSGCEFSLAQSGGPSDRRFCLLYPACSAYCPQTARAGRPRAVPRPRKCSNSSDFIQFHRTLRTSVQIQSEFSPALSSSDNVGGSTVLSRPTGRVRRHCSCERAHKILISLRKLAIHPTLSLLLVRHGPPRSRWWTDCLRGRYGLRLGKVP